MFPPESLIKMIFSFIIPTKRGGGADTHGLLLLNDLQWVSPHFPHHPSLMNDGVYSRRAQMKEKLFHTFTLKLT